MCAAGFGIGFICVAQAPMRTLCVVNAMFGVSWQTQIKESSFYSGPQPTRINDFLGSAQTNKGIIPLFGSAEASKKGIILCLVSPADAKSAHS